MSLSEGDFVVCYNFPGETKPRSCVVLKIVGKDCILIKVTTTKIHSKNHPQYAFCIPVSENPISPSYLYINKITTIDTTEQVTINNKSKDCVQLVTNNGQKISMDPTSFQDLKEKIKSLLL
eukprot:gene7664-12130_t